MVLFRLRSGWMPLQTTVCRSLRQPQGCSSLPALIGLMVDDPTQRLTTAPSSKSGLSSLVSWFSSSSTKRRRHRRKSSGSSSKSSLHNDNDKNNNTLTSQAPPPTRHEPEPEQEPQEPCGISLEIGDQDFGEEGLPHDENDRMEALAQALANNTDMNADLQQGLLEQVRAMDDMSEEELKQALLANGVMVDEQEVDHYSDHDQDDDEVVLEQVPPTRR